MMLRRAPSSSRQSVWTSWLEKHGEEGHAERRQSPAEALCAVCGVRVV